MGIQFCGCTNNVTSATETNIVIQNFYKMVLFTQYRINKEPNNVNKIQYYNNNFIKNWTLEKFNSLPLIQRITMINQANRIIQAYRNYIKTRRVRAIILI